MDNAFAPTGRVVIIGAGELGQAVGMLLTENGVTVDFWDADPARVPGQKPLADIVPGAAAVLFCVPSWSTRAAVTGVALLLQPPQPSQPPAETIVVSFAKGIEKDSLQTMAELVPTLLPAGQPFVVAGGPMLAAEISGGMTAAGVFASHNDAALQKMKALFANGRFRVETSADPEGVALAGVLKNIYAVALGIADGLALSGNEKGWITACAIREMRGIATALGVGASADVALGTAGAADFIATGYSVHSRNRETGLEIVATGTCDVRGEGLNALPFLLERLGKEKAAAFPLLALINAVSIECQPARPAFAAFFTAQAA